MAEIIEAEAREVQVEERPVEKAEEKKEVAVTTQGTQLGMNPYESTSSFNNFFTMGKYLANSDLVPETYKNKPMNCVIALEQAQRMNCSPMLVMQNLYIVKGKPTWSGQACSMLINACGLFENVDLNYVGTKGKDDYGAYVSAIRKSDGKELKGTTVDMAMVKGEGWDKNPKWKTMTEQMLGYRAFSFFARLYCPNALSGFRTEGEVEDVEYSRKSADAPSIF